MITKQQFIDWLRQSGNSDNIILAALLEQNIIGMPKAANAGITEGGGQ
jgi:hypothetical protein